MIEVMGFLTPFIVYLCITLLHFFLPGRWVVGYVDNPNTGQKLRYRLNGRLVLLASIGLWYTLGYLGGDGTAPTPAGGVVPLGRPATLWAKAAPLGWRG